MSKAPAMPMFWDAYLADTTHLSTEEHGAYLLLLAAMWRRDGRLPDNDKDNARILGLTVGKWRRVKDRLSSFLVIEDGHISQKNLRKIWKKTQEKIAKNVQNGVKGGRPKIKENNDLGKPNGSVSNKPNETIPEPEPEPNNLEPKGSLPASSKAGKRRNDYPEDFERFWKSYPTSPNMSKREAFKEWKKLNGDDRIKALAAVAPFKIWIAKQREYSPVYAERFLKQRRFDGHAEQVGSQIIHLAKKTLIAVHEEPELFDAAVTWARDHKPEAIRLGQEHIQIPAQVAENLKKYIQSKGPSA